MLAKTIHAIQVVNCCVSAVKSIEFKLQGLDNLIFGKERAMMKRAFLFRHVLIVMLVLAAAIFLRAKPSPSAWLPGWEKRMPLLVIEKSGNTITDYSARIVLNSSTFDFLNCKPEGKDVRFTDKDGNLLSYWIESWPATIGPASKAVIWVKLPQIGPYEKKEIFLYYKNTLAESYSNLGATMSFVEVVEESLSSTNGTSPQWQEIGFEEPEKIQAVICSPPTSNDDSPVTVRIKKENGRWFAQLAESSLSDNAHGGETVFFLGVPEGDVKFTDGTRLASFVVATTATISQNLSPTEISFELAPFQYSNDVQETWLTSLNSFQSSSVQERLARAESLKNTSVSSLVSIRGEFDNTRPFSEKEHLAVVRMSAKSSSTQVFESMSGTFGALQFKNFSTTVPTFTVSFDESLFEDSPTFASATFESLGYSPFLRFSTLSSTSAELFFQNDDTAPPSTPCPPTTATVQVVRFASEGKFPVSKYVYPEPDVLFNRISGRVFEDKNADGSPFEESDSPKAGVKVRIYEDLNKDGKISDADLFVMETHTDRNGMYHLPAAGSRAYIVAVSAESFARSDEKSLNPGFSTSELLPEQTFVREFRQGSFFAERVPGGVNPFQTDKWSEETLPSKNIYEHVAEVIIDEEEKITGIDFGFSYELITNSKDFNSNSPSIQGSLRQALKNSNALQGRQELVFDLFKSDPSYNSVTEQYFFSPLEPLPDIIDPLSINGDKAPGNSSGSILLSGEHIPLETGLFVKAPFTEIKNLAFAGFQNAVRVETFQYSREFNQPLATATPDSLIPFRINASDTSLIAATGRQVAFINRDLSQLIEHQQIKDSAIEESQFWLNRSHSGKNLALVFGAKSNYVYTKATDFLSGLFEYTLPASGNEAKVFIKSTRAFENSVSVNDKVLTVPSAGKVFNVASKDHVFSIQTSTPASLYSLTPQAIPLFSNSFTGKRFAAFLSSGEELIVYPANSGSNPHVSILHISEENIETTKSTTAPFVYTAETTGAVFLSSDKAFYTAIKPLFAPPISLSSPSTDMCSVFTDDAQLLAYEDASATITVFSESGNSATVNLFLPKGKPVYFSNIEQIKDLLGKDIVVGVQVKSSAPVSGIAISNNKGKPNQPSMYGFLRTDLLGNAFLLHHNGSGVEICEFTPKSKVVRRRFTAHSVYQTEEPALVFYKNNLTGSYTLAQSNMLSADPDFPSLAPLGDLASFDADILIDSCIFLANKTAINVASGAGITVTKCLFFSNTLNVDTGDDGSSLNDGALSIHQANSGMDKPVITSAILFESTLTVEGYIGTMESSSSFDGSKVEVFLSDLIGQAYYFLGAVEVSDGKFKLSLPADNLNITAQDRVIAIATNLEGSTSEFSDPLRVDPAPIISNVRATHILPSSDPTFQPTVTTITWSTDIPSTSKVIYDIVSRAATETYSYETTLDATLLTTHTVSIVGLEVNTIYYFRVVSENIEGDVTTSHEYMIPPGRAEADSDLCAFCHRSHTGIATPLRLPYSRY